MEGFHTVGTWPTSPRREGERRVVLIHSAVAGGTSRAGGVCREAPF